MSQTNGWTAYRDITHGHLGPTVDIAPGLTGRQAKQVAQ